MDYEKPFFHAQSGRRAGRQGASVPDWALLLLKVLWAVVLLHHPSRALQGAGGQGPVDPVRGTNTNRVCI